MTSTPKSAVEITGVDWAEVRSPTWQRLLGFVPQPNLQVLIQFPVGLTKGRGSISAMCIIRRFGARGAPYLLALTSVSAQAADLADLLPALEAAST